MKFHEHCQGSPGESRARVKSALCHLIHPVGLIQYMGDGAYVLKFGVIQS